MRSGYGPDLKSKLDLMPAIVGLPVTKQWLNRDLRSCKPPLRSDALSVTDTTFDVARQTSSRVSVPSTKIFILHWRNQ